MRNLYFVRHGKPEFPGGKKCCIGWTDLSLSEEGRSQIAELKKQFENEAIEKIYTSPLKRCVESARILSELLSGGQIPVEIVEDMKEIGMGEWEGLPFSEIREKYPEEYEERGKDLAYFRPQGGESFVMCQKRAVRVFERISRETRGNVILMAHAGFNRTLISYLENRKLKNILEIPQEYAGVYTYPEYIFDGMIVAAGMSTRMGAFKPFLELGGKRVIDRELDTLRSGGAREIAVVTGYRAEEIQAAVETHVFEAPGSVTCLHNPAYAETKMFDSVTIGLRHFLEKWKSPEGKTMDGIFFLPVDVPLFTRFTMEWEKQRFAEGDGDVYCPYYEGAAGHPLLIRSTALEALLSHNGERGLKGAYERLGDRVIYLTMTDKGAVMDADTKEDFSRLENYEKERAIPNESMCREILSWFHVREDTRAHCEAVGRFARALALACNEALQRQEQKNDSSRTEDQGRFLNPDLVYAAGLLHDVAKGKADHASDGARWLSHLGHEEVAEIVGDHMDLPEKKLESLNESVIVYLADKMMAKNVKVTVDERFAPKREMFKGNPKALLSLEERYRKAKRAEEMVEALTGPVFEIACD